MPNEKIYNSQSKTEFKQGLKDGIPIALGYFAVSFTLGIAAANAGLTAAQGFITSLLINASAGEYAGFAVIAAKASYLEMAIITLVTNARYLLMSCSLSQKLSPELDIKHRLLIGYDVTDELFGIMIARNGFLNPYYAYGAFFAAAPCWAGGTALGIIAGNVLPLSAVSALSVALYGMFLAVIIPPCRTNKILAALVGVSFLLSYIAEKVPPLCNFSSGSRIIFLTLVLAAGAAILFPIGSNEAKKDDEA